MPTHGAGSFCSSTAVGGQRMSTLSNEQVVNPALASGDLDAFRAVHVPYSAPIPGYYQHMAPINRAGPRVYCEPPRPARLEADAVAALDRNQVQLIDVRVRTDYVRAHVPGSVLIEESDAMLAYFGWLVPFNAPLALVSGDAAQAERVTADLFRIGDEDVRGYIAFNNWTVSGWPVASIETMTAEQVADVLRVGRKPVLDVRFAYEHTAQSLIGALARPLDRLQEWAPALPPTPALVVCQSGERAAMAASFLTARGHDVRCLIQGGADEVQAALAATSTTR